MQAIHHDADVAPTPAKASPIKARRMLARLGRGQPSLFGRSFAASQWQAAITANHRPPLEPKHLACENAKSLAATADQRVHAPNRRERRGDISGI